MRSQNVVFPILAGLALAAGSLSPATAAPPPDASTTTAAAVLVERPAAAAELPPTTAELEQVQAIRSASRLQDALSTTAMLGGLFGLFAVAVLVLGRVDPRLRVRRPR